MSWLLAQFLLIITQKVQRIQVVLIWTLHLRVAFSALFWLSKNLHSLLLPKNIGQIISAFTPAVMRLLTPDWMFVLTMLNMWLEFEFFVWFITECCGILCWRIPGTENQEIYPISFRHVRQIIEAFQTAVHFRWVWDLRCDARERAVSLHQCRAWIGEGRQRMPSWGKKKQRKEWEKKHFLSSFEL